MSLMFKPPANDSNLDPKLVRTMLDENALLIKIVTEYQNKGKIYECMKYHDILARNLLYLSGKSDFQADENFLKNQWGQVNRFPDFTSNPHSSGPQ